MNTIRNPGDLFTREERFKLIEELLGFKPDQVRLVDMKEFILARQAGWLKRHEEVVTIFRDAGLKTDARSSRPLPGAVRELTFQRKKRKLMKNNDHSLKSSSLNYQAEG